MSRFAKRSSAATRALWPSRLQPVEVAYLSLQRTQRGLVGMLVVCAVLGMTVFRVPPGTLGNRTFLPIIFSTSLLTFAYIVRNAMVLPAAGGIAPQPPRPETAQALEPQQSHRAGRCARAVGLMGFAMQLLGAATLHCAHPLCHCHRLSVSAAARQAIAVPAPEAGRLQCCLRKEICLQGDRPCASRRHAECPAGHRPLLAGHPRQRFHLCQRADSARSGNPADRPGRSGRADRAVLANLEAILTGGWQQPGESRAHQRLSQGHGRIRRHERRLRTLLSLRGSGAFHRRGRPPAQGCPRRNRRHRPGWLIPDTIPSRRNNPVAAFVSSCQ